MRQLTFLLLAFICICSNAAYSQSLANFPVIDVHIHSNNSLSHEPNIKPNKNMDVISPATYSTFRKQFFYELKKNNVVLCLVSGPLSMVGIWKDTLNTRFYYSFQVNTPSIYKSKIDTIFRLFQEGKLSGIGELGQQYAGRNLSDTIYEDLYNIAEQFNKPVAIHTGGGPSQVFTMFAPKFRYEYGNPYHLQELLIQRPKLKVFMMHAGLPNYGREALAMMHMFPNLYVDIGVLGWVGRYEQKSLKEFLNDAMIAGFGDRIMFGSDGQFWPQSISLSIDFIKKADFLTINQKKDILYFNAARFLGLSDRQIKKDVSQE
jgi:predicted TIM-barrel fold metal-dependent hydrolase